MNLVPGPQLDPVASCLPCWSPCEEPLSFAQLGGGFPPHLCATGPVARPPAPFPLPEEVIFYLLQLFCNSRVLLPHPAHLPNSHIHDIQGRHLHRPHPQSSGPCPTGTWVSEPWSDTGQEPTVRSHFTSTFAASSFHCYAESFLSRIWVIKMVIVSPFTKKEVASSSGITKT